MLIRIDKILEIPDMLIRGFNMYVCMYLCVYVYLYVCMYVRMYAYRLFCKDTDRLFLKSLMGGVSINNPIGLSGETNDFRKDNKKKILNARKWYICRV